MNSRAIVEKAMDKLSNQPIDEYEVFAYHRDHALTRFANSVIHQQVQSDIMNIRIRVGVGKRMMTTTGVANEQTVDEIVSGLISDVNTAPEQSFFQGFAERSDFTGFITAGKVLDVDQRSDVVQRAVNTAAEVDTRALLYGKVESLDFDYAIQNSNGVRGDHRIIFNDYKFLSIIDEGIRGFGREELASQNSVDVEKMVSSAVKISADTLNARSVDAGEYDVILRPNASSELISYSIYGLNAHSFHQKNSAFTDRIGEQLLSEDLTIRDVPLDPESLLSSPFDADGMPTQNREIIDKGVPKIVYYDLMSASQFLDDKNSSTAHSVLPFSEYIFGGSMPSNIEVEEGDMTEQEMIEDTKRGLLIQTFWYTNTVNMVKGVLTGLTRDGLYLIEDGEIKHAVKNLRFTDSFLSFYNNINGIENKQHTLLSEFGSTSKVPMMRLDKFRFTGKSTH